MTPRLTIIFLFGFLALISVPTVGTVSAKCPGLPPPPGGGPDPYGIALDIGSVTFFAVVAYFLIRSRLRGQNPSE